VLPLWTTSEKVLLPVGATFKNSFGKLKSVSKKQKIGRCFDIFFQNVKETRQKKHNSNNNNKLEAGLHRWQSPYSLYFF
jgi:hypothetical protein